MTTTTLPSRPARPAHQPPAVAHREPVRPSLARLLLDGTAWCLTDGRWVDGATGADLSSCDVAHVLALHAAGDVTWEPDAARTGRLAALVTPAAADRLAERAAALPVPRARALYARAVALEGAACLTLTARAADAWQGTTRDLGDAARHVRSTARYVGQALTGAADGTKLLPHDRLSRAWDETTDALDAASDAYAPEGRPSAPEWDRPSTAAGGWHRTGTTYAPPQV